MSNDKEPIAVRVAVEVSPEALEAVVKTVREMLGRNEKGHYHVDTADAVGAMISRFLGEKDFEGFVKDPENYAGMILE